jgi:hypothetical protein
MNYKIGKAIYDSIQGQYAMMTRGADNPSHVHANVYIGSLESATHCKLSDYHITNIINLSGAVYDSPVRMVKIDIDDVYVQCGAISDFMNTFAVALAVLEECKGNILVHCMAGVNRSAFLIGFWMWHNGHRFEDIVAKLRDANSRRNLPAFTNPSFEYILCTLCHARRAVVSRNMMFKIQKKKVGEERNEKAVVTAATSAVTSTNTMPAVTTPVCNIPVPPTVVAILESSDHTGDNIDCGIDNISANIDDDSDHISD